MKLKLTSALSVVALLCGFSACNNSSNNTVNAGNAANKSNTAVVTNANSTTSNNAGTAASNTGANMTSSANTGGAADGQAINIDEAGLTMNVPKGMNFSKDGQDIIVKTEDEGVDTRFRVLTDDNIDKSFDEAFKEINEYVSNAKLESKEPKKSNKNGLEINSWNGTGKASNGDDVLFQLAIVDAGAGKKPLMALTYAEAESIQKHQADLSKFFESLRKQ